MQITQTDKMQDYRQGMNVARGTFGTEKQAQDRFMAMARIVKEESNHNVGL